MKALNTLGIMTATLFLGCQDAEIINRRGLCQDGRRGDAVTAINLDSKALGLANTSASAISGSVGCGDMSIAFSGASITLTPEMINAGTCTVRLASFELAGTVYDLVSGASGNDWSRNTIHAFSEHDESGQIMDPKSIYILVSAQLPAGIVGGQAYNVDFVAFQSRAAGDRQIDIIQATEDATATAALTHVSAPKFSLTSATKEGGTYSFAFSCDEAFDATNLTCEGQPLATNLLIMLTTVAIDPVTDAFLVYNYAADYGTIANPGQDEEFHLFGLDADNRLTTEVVEMSVAATDSGLILNVIYLGDAPSMNILLQYYEAGATPLPFSSVTSAKVTL